MIKNRINFIFFYFFVFTIPCFSFFSLDDLDSQSHKITYNSLPSIEKADASLKSKTCFQDFLSKAGDIVISYGFEEYVGVRLNHRHFSLESQEVMLEDFEISNNVPSLVTKAHPLSLAREKGAVPSGWLFLNSQPTIFEFSTDPAVKAGLRKIMSFPKFLKDMGKLIEEYNFQDLMSVGLLKKESLPAVGDQIYWERNYLKGESVVQLTSPIVEAERVFWTAWRFDSDPIKKCTMCYGCADPYDEDYCGANHH